MSENKFSLNKWIWVVLVGLIIILVIFILWSWRNSKDANKVANSPTPSVTTSTSSAISPLPGNNLISKKGETLIIDRPQANSKVKSPLEVSGQVKGNWSFEASFPVVLMDANEKILAQVPASLEGDWMTTNYVPFKVKLTFQTPSTSNGKLILKKDNPSDNSELDDQLEIPVKF